MKELQAYLLERYAEQTAERYGREIERYLATVPGAWKSTYREVTGYVGALRKRYPNPRTLNRMLCAIKAYYDFLSTTGKRKDNPARSIYLRDNKSREVQLQDLFTEEELESLLERKEQFTVLSLRNRLLTSLLIYQALRPGELENLRTEDVNLEAGTIYIRATARSDARTLPLKPNQILLFSRYLSEVRPRLNRHAEEDKLLLGLRGEAM